MSSVPPDRVHLLTKRLEVNAGERTSTIELFYFPEPKVYAAYISQGVSEKCARRDGIQGLTHTVVRASISLFVIDVAHFVEWWGMDYDEVLSLRKEIEAKCLSHKNSLASKIGEI